MILRVFNPEHDIALAANRERFTPPRAGRQLRHDLGFLPALWSRAGEIVLVDDVDAAVQSLSALRECLPVDPGVRLVSHAEVGKVLTEFGEIEIQPWGWDRVLRSQLLADGIEASYMPSNELLAVTREISNRKWAAGKLLPNLLALDPSLVGMSRHCADFESLEQEISRMGQCLCKSPWSSSGRGLRLVETSEMSLQTVGWIRRIIEQQGGIMVEPYYRKVCDFAMEFRSTTDGIVYEGLSLFSTQHGAYAGNILASEETKRAMLGQQISLELLDVIRDRIISVLTQKMPVSSMGPFGVDMMIVADGNDSSRLRIHPCVELNFRMTMGHVALALSSQAQYDQHVMCIAYDGDYHLEILSR